MSVSRRSGASSLRAVVSRAAQRLPVLVDAYRLARNPKWETEIWRDYLATRRETAFIRRLVPADRAPRVLVALYRDDIFDAKMGMVLATALRLRGLAPTVLLPSRRASRTARYVECLGPVDLVDWAGTELSDAEQHEVDTALDWFDATAPDFDQLRAWRFRGYQAGNHVLSSVIRLTFEADPDLAVPAIRDLTRSVLHDVLVAYLRADRLLDRVDPRVLLVEEANYSLQGPLVDVAVARGVDVVHTVSIWRDDALWSKRITPATRRTEPKSVDAVTLDELEREPWGPQQDAELDLEMTQRYGSTWGLGGQFQADTKEFSADDLRTMLDLDPTKPTAVIFSHVLWDASLFFGDDLFLNYGDWLAHAIEAAAANPNVNWVIKAHPANVFRERHGDVAGESREVALARQVLPELPSHVKLLLPDTEVSTLSLYRFADYGLTVRGTPGLEMASFGKTVLTAGTGHYSGLGFTHDSASIADYLALLGRIERLPPLDGDQTRRARRYLHALFRLRPWSVRSVDMTFEFRDEGWHPLDRNVRWAAHSVDAIEANGDFDEWAAWVLDGKSVDFVHPRPVGSALRRELSPAVSSAASVLAIVLTFDAPDHVARCVEHLGRQSTPPGAILVLDNHGSHPADEETLARLAGVPLTVWRLPENGGPAGGYFAGLSRFLGSDFRTAWVMDDDLQPDPECLAELLADLDAAGRRAVVGPAILDAESGERCDGWGWVGVLIPREGVETVGVPRRDLFWCLEDQEYLRDRLPLAGFGPRRAEAAVARVTRRPDWRDDARIEGVPFQHDKPAWKYYYEVRNHTYRYLYDRSHLDRSVRLKSLANYLSAYARMVSRERSGRTTKAACALRGLFDGTTVRLGRRVEPSSADRPPA